MWFRILILALGTFAIGTDGFVVAGVLGDISTETHVSVSVAGQLVTMFAWVYAVASPVVAALTGRFPRKTMLIFALVVFTVGNVLAAVAPSYEVLALGRVLAAIGAAAYTPAASVTAIMLAPEAARGRALSVVIGGITVATVLGVPLGTYLGSRTSFHGVFWLVTALGVAALLLIAALLPKVPSPPAVDLKTRLGMLKLPGVRPTLLVNVLAFIGGFTVYTYLQPLLTEITHINGQTLSLMLMTFGVGGAVGNVLGGWLTDRWGAYRTALASLATFFLFLALLPVVATTVAGAAVVIFFWGVTGWLMVAPQQHRLVSLAPKAAPLLLSLNASAMYVGIGSAALVGGTVVKLAGVRYVGIAGAVAGALALVLFLITAAARAKATPATPEAQPAGRG
ncbi:MFS transporter [Longispora fulva]|uniref:Putative MFS family arabinose efflux permease n=1 Tax=Longispora fulva TaxID=619741 RepID=A0A8J7KIN2_9ACTN|nr:MFS transporter [Longispora fulva]MBG6134346.1 putative MFS family arabinose efflux permease [Longispora fulva]GIG63055.1 MFS transporter [Longispora fulva]